MQYKHKLRHIELLPLKMPLMLFKLIKFGAIQVLDQTIQVNPNNIAAIRNEFATYL